MRQVVSTLSLLALAACAAPPAPQGGVGFQSYNDYLRQQAANARPATMPIATPAAGTDTSAAALAAETMAALRGPQAAAPAAPLAPAAALTAMAAPTPAPAPVATPAPAPAASSSSGANIAAFALSTSHPIGQKMYRRINPLRDNMAARACARYPSDALAQEAFLAAGGPERDRHGLDPDGDGYACRWDPAPFRLARQTR